MTHLLQASPIKLNTPGFDLQKQALVLESLRRECSVLWNWEDESLDEPIVVSLVVFATSAEAEKDGIPIDAFASTSIEPDRARLVVIVDVCTGVREAYSAYCTGAGLLSFLFGYPLTKGMEAYKD